MMHIKVEVINVLPDSSTPPGVYFYSGVLYLCPGHGMVPTCTATGQIKIENDLPISSDDGGMSEDFVLKLVAITARPDNARDLLK